VRLCSPQIRHDLTWARILPAAVGFRRLTAWATTRRYWICRTFGLGVMFLALYMCLSLRRPKCIGLLYRGRFFSPFWVYVDVTKVETYTLIPSVWFLLSRIEFYEIR
jgi:hypothetical protein